MQKRKTLLVAAAVGCALCLTTGAVYLNAGGGIGEKKLEERQAVQDEKSPDLGDELLQEADISKLERASVRPEESVQSYIRNLFENGGSKTEADLYALLDIVKFWEDTNDEITIVGEIYARRPLAEVLTKWSSNRPWIESAYNDITGRDDILSTEEVKAYLEAGLSYEDMTAASRLSLKGEVTTKQALSRVSDGEPWYSIVTGEAAESAVQKTVSPNVLLDARNLAEAKQVSVNTVLERVEAGETLNALKAADLGNAAESAFEVETEESAEIIEDEIIEDSVNNTEAAEETEDTGKTEESEIAENPADASAEPARAAEGLDISGNTVMPEGGEAE